MADRPRGREKNITGTGAGANRRGSGTGMGPVGSGSNLAGSGSGGNRASGTRAGGSKLGLVIIILVVLLGGGTGGISALLGGSGNSSTDGYSSGIAENGSTSALSGVVSNLAGTSSGSGSSYSGLWNSVGGTSTGWTYTANTGSLDRSVASGARDKYTAILGNGQDTVTILVYMCGTDLESRSGMATNDLNEMANATIADNVNLIVYTGGCKQWKNSVISSSVNQIYQVKGGGLKRLVDDAGTGAMTDPATLTSFLQYGAENFPANRNMLIFWDHGGGSVSGYGYDEKHSGSGSMSLSGINTALADAGMKFDFIGFDACLMATLETDLMIANYADYCIASEETEPGVGWYYTNWLTKLSADTSMDTIEIGKNIVDDFVDVCARSCAGQKTTLSVVDLAELSAVIGDDLKEFSRSTTDLITSGEYAAVSNARANTREFAQSSKIDQVDLVTFAKNIGTDEGNELAQTLLNAVKYNRTSSNMTNAYGISIYFPLNKTSYVSSAVKNYDQIGLDAEYSACIREFASLELSGQAATGGSSYGIGGTSNALSLLGALSGSGSSGSSASGLDSILSLVSAFSGGGTSGSIAGLADIFGGRSLSDERTAQIIADNYFDAGQLVWRTNADGEYIISLPEDQWALVHSVDLNVYVDDGEGYIDLGLDNLFSFDDDGNLVADTDGTWIAINNQPVAYYHTDTTEDTITGYVPAMLNGERVKLILIYDFDSGEWTIAGADPDYDSNVTDAIARGLTELETGDTLDFLCDYYTYDGTFLDSYYFGNPMTVTEEMTVSDVYLTGDYIALYRFTDLYNQNYWTERVPK